jgi:hypothetical protein
MRKPVFSLVALAAIGASTPVWSCDRYEVQTLQQGGDTYDPAQLTERLIRLVVQAPEADQDCAALSAVVRPRDGAGGISLRRMGETLESRPVGSPAVARANTSMIEISPAFRQTLFRDGQIAFDLLRIDPGQFVPVGDYVAELEWVVDGQEPQPLDIRVRVEPSVRFVGDDVRRLSLGEVSDGGEASSRFFYATNASLRVTARSQNNGRLQHELGAAYGTIDYDAFLSGAKLDLSMPALINLPLKRATLRSEELRVQVNPQKRRYAGTYRDVLTLDFVAF